MRGDTVGNHYLDSVGIAASNLHSNWLRYGIVNVDDTQREPNEPLSTRQLWIRIAAAIVAIIVGTILGLLVIGWLMSFALKLIVNES